VGIESQERVFGTCYGQGSTLMAPKGCMISGFSVWTDDQAYVSALGVTCSPAPEEGGLVMMMISNRGWLAK
jgi:hypothetical protein